MSRLPLLSIAALAVALAASPADADPLTRADCDRMADTLREIAEVTAGHRMLLTSYGSTPMDREVARAQRMMAVYGDLVDQYVASGCGRLESIRRD